ncbi:hypothetical protein TNCT_130731 [Trichonephila clavata]|uniref:Uncharacterized protein n=1 Tax=Trichonephila clavata TaxID=2740835 RepID=A0A8X6HFA8_TRICU|nr:hypothetical protein TNCT_130731 [Trichonephila clavata]
MNYHAQIEGGTRNQTKNDLEQPNKSIESQLWGFPGRSTGVVVLNSSSKNTSRNYQLKSSALLNRKDGKKTTTAQFMGSSELIKNRLQLKKRKRYISSAGGAIRNPLRPSRKTFSEKARTFVSFSGAIRRAWWLKRSSPR